MKNIIVGIILLFSLGLFSQQDTCEATFEIPTEALFSNLPVYFEDNSTYQSITTAEWYWTFENGIPSESNSPTPIVSFPEPGEYIVCLTLFENNCSSEICDTIVIEDKDPEEECIAEFDHYSDGTDHVYFVNNSLPEEATYHWTFGDGYISNDDNPIHIYSTVDTIYNVCLVMETTTGCMDTVCHPVWVGVETDCQAFFEADPGFWPNTFEFTDLSFGDPGPISWHWDFGDGTTSNSGGEVNHTFMDSGYYEVCLTIQTPDCESSYCTYVFVENNLGGDCQAAFEVQEEYCENCFSFTNFSVGDVVSYYWDFGDGDVMFDVANPGHTFMDSGYYEVCLTIYTNDECVNTYCQPVFAPYNLMDSLYFLSGNVKAGSVPLPQGMAILYKETASGGFYAHKKCPINHGYYNFELSVPGNYLIHAVPFFDLENYFPVYFPTYYGHSIFWEEATALNVNESSMPFLDIQLVKCDSLLYGPSETNGVVSVSDEADFEEDIFNTLWFVSDSSRNRDVPIGPAMNIPVFLLDEENEPYRFFLTDEDGFYQFDKFPYGNFKLYPEKAGLTTVPISLVFTEEETEIFEQNFLIRINDIVYDATDIDEITTIDHTVYPNPIGDQFNIIIENNGYDNAIVIMYNNMGQVVFNDTQKLNDFNKITVNSSQLSSGFYTLEMIIDGQFRIVKKIIK